MAEAPPHAVCTTGEYSEEQRQESLTHQILLLQMAAYLHLTEDAWQLHRSGPVLFCMCLTWWLPMCSLLLSMSVILVRWPLLANHTMLWCFVGFAILARQRRACVPILGIVYFAAGFHKINTDFASLDGGCMQNFLFRFHERAGVGFAWALWDATIVWYLAVLIISVELVGGLVILSPVGRLQVHAARTVFLLLHAPTAAISFFDFGSVALSCLVSRLPTPRRAVTCCVAMNLLASLSTSVQFRGVLFVFSALPLLSGRAQCPPPIPRGGLWGLHRAAYGALVGAVLLVASGAYLGLGSAGGLTMFSNLAVYPDGTSNHLLLPRTPAVFTFQRDLWLVHNVSLRGRWRKMPATGQVIPLAQLWHLQRRHSLEIWAFPLKNLTSHNFAPQPALIPPAPWWIFLFPFAFHHNATLYSGRCHW